MNKSSCNSFSEKIFPEQFHQLIHWLAEHTYSRVQTMIAAPPPDGFGMQVSISTICRFYKAHQEQIEGIRRAIRHQRAAERRLASGAQPQSYRASLVSDSKFSIQERLFELLCRPSESVDDLKKLVGIAHKVQELKTPFVPDRRRYDSQNAQTDRQGSASAPNLASQPPVTRT